ncbi:hypothetical protein U9M48_003298 [Paspalum notatum var. saurae]|uniref:Uncharacterized protein n=1 Tax=Paspalum notatum var. saurae TaxID=547442 RepID=A0AAQ3SGS5_PASNO
MTGDYFCTTSLTSLPHPPSSPPAAVDPAISPQQFHQNDACREDVHSPHGPHGNLKDNFTMDSDSKGSGRCMSRHAKGWTTRNEKQEKYMDAEPSAIDHFKEMHCSKKNCFSENVQKAIVGMEEMVAASVEAVQQPKSPI